MIGMRHSNIVLIAAGLLAIAACSAPRQDSARPAASPIVLESPGGIGATRSSANGRSLYQTGKDLDGVQIVAQPRTDYLSCAACHKVDGSGGMHLTGGAVSADLRHKSLVTAQKHPYTVASLERAISTGIDNEGQMLNPVMPHWQLSKQDLHDVAVYVYTQLR